MGRIADRVEMSGATPAAEGASAVDGPDEEARRRIRARWMSGGFAIGIVLGFVVTAGHVAYSGFHILPFQLVWNLIWLPYTGAIFGYNRARGAGLRSWKRPQLRTRTLMVAVAYVALLFGMGVSTDRLGRSALRYYQKYVTSESMARIFREQGRKSEAEAGLRRTNLAGLRAGNIPEGLLPEQRDFLRSLEADPKATPEFREYRRGLIADGEEMMATMQGRNAVVYRGLVEYHEKLAARYDRARWRPWLPVEPDPPMPPTR